jgi:hypothetical protein
MDNLGYLRERCGIPSPPVLKQHGDGRRVGIEHEFRQYTKVTSDKKSRRGFRGVLRSTQ